MPHNDLVFEVLKNDLSAPRVLLQQVLDYINDHYTYPAIQVRKFFDEKFPTLEDYEVDLVFSPQYTPAEHNRLEYIPLLGEKALSAAEVAMLKGRLVDTKLETLLQTPDGEVEMLVPVHEVFIDRYVNLLKLDQKLPEGVFEEIKAHVPAESRHEVNLLARDDIWQHEGRRAILIAFLRTFEAQHNFSTLKVSFLTNFARTYRPTGIQDLDRQFDSLIQSCLQDMENVNSRGFHDEYLKAVNAGNNLAQPNAKDVWAHYKHMMDMSTQLRQDAQHFPETAPDLLHASQSAV